MSTQTSNLQLIKPDRDEFYDIQVQNNNMDKIDESVHSLSTNVEEHLGNKNNPHGVTKSQIGLSNVPNVATNDQTPTYTPASANTTLTSGEKLSIAFGKISKAISSLISHLADTVGHITSAERTKWNGKLDATAITATGLTDEYLTNLTISPNFTLQNLCNCNTVTFFTNWYDSTNFPKIYGSGVMIPCADISNRLIVYGDITNNTTGFHIGNAKFINGVWSVDWYNSANNGNADTLDGLHASSFVTKDSTGKISIVPIFTGGVGNTEGGEIHLAKPPISDIVKSDITVDIVDRYFRIFCTTAEGTRIAKIDFSSLTGDNNILHTGTSAPVKIQDTAPTDTTALWIS